MANYPFKLTTLARDLQPLIRHPEGSGPGPEPGDFNLQRIHLLDRSAGVSYDYAPTDANLDIAIATSEPGDIIFIPAVTLTGAHTFPAEVEIVGFGQENTILTGVITISSGSSAITNLSILVTGESEEPILALWGPEDGELRIHECHIKGDNTGNGGGFGIGKRGGDIYMEGGWLEGSLLPVLTFPEPDQDWRQDYYWVSSCPPVSATPYSLTVLCTSDELGVACHARLYSKEGLMPPHDPVMMRAELASSGMYTQLGGGPNGILTYTGVVSDVFDGQITSSVNAYDIGVYPPKDGVVNVQVAGSIVSYMNWGIRARAAIGDHGAYPGHSFSHIMPVRFSLYTPEELEQLEGEYFAYPGFFTSAVRMDPVVGEPTWGDKSAWNTKKFYDRHASDIADRTFTYHVDPGSGGALTLSNQIILYRSNLTAETFDFSAEGLNQAISQASQPDLIEIKAAGIISGEIVFYENVKVLGNSGVIIDGSIRGAAGAELSGATCRINRDSAEDAIAVYGPEGGVFTLKDCEIDISNTGDAYGYWTSLGGNIKSLRSNVNANSSGGLGYAGRSIAGKIIVQDGGLYVGSTDAFLTG